MVFLITEITIDAAADWKEHVIKTVLVLSNSDLLTTHEAWGIL